MILAGDIGGTKAMLLVAEVRQDKVLPLFERRYPVASFSGFNAMLAQFLHAYRESGAGSAVPVRACFGAAGPVEGGRIQMVNWHWCLDAAQIAAEFGFARVRLVNDFEAAASGVEALNPDDWAVLQPGEPLADAPRVVMGAGTGLGIAYALPEGAGYRIIAGEGGHTGFAPANEEQARLWQGLHATFGRVCVEHVVSGPGLARVYRFVIEAEHGSAARAETAVATDSADISRLALEQGDPAACRALDLFIACYGAVAGDHALAVAARGGVYIAGGIAPKILRRLVAGGFLDAFNAKGSHASMNRKMPVRVVTTERLGLLGAALIAARR